MADPDLTRERWRRLIEPPSAPPHPPAGAAAFVGSVVTAAPAVDHYIVVNPTAVTGTETEGGAGTFTVGPAAVPVLLLGPSTPSAGDLLLCRLVDHRWVAERAHPPGGGACDCAIPTSPTLSLEDPANVSVPGTYSATLVKITTFIDYRIPVPFWSSPGGLMLESPSGLFAYGFWCAGGIYTVYRINEDGEGHVTNVLPLAHFRMTGVNTCSPFSLTSPYAAFAVFDTVVTG